jgi:hypothetical protein
LLEARTNEEWTMIEQSLADAQVYQMFDNRMPTSESGIVRWTLALQVPMKLNREELEIEWLAKEASFLPPLFWMSILRLFLDGLKRER